ncbi:hypothetical protein B1987_09445 [Mycobacterium kansasii]|uniref:Uncharacterized protein n=1 Tax=Mycobacterium attenuatum TaxID=2341086 RepID=A0A498QBJ9_9MYCO|nr:hypothetical protein B1987_09445 [Mycobacterium kansasii]VBA42359.1 hypothetical protein LAUMK136_04539 [Mycobacterium attenuatum]
MDWRGAAADTLRTETHSDMLTTSAVADQLHEAAKVARSGAADLYAARSRVRYAVQDARAAGFDVGEDLSVTDRSSGGSAAQRAARLTQAQAFAGDIRQRAVQLSGSISKSSPKSPPSWPASATPSRQRLSRRTGTRQARAGHRQPHLETGPDAGADAGTCHRFRAPTIFARCCINCPSVIPLMSGRSAHQKTFRTCGGVPNRTG